MTSWWWMANRRCTWEWRVRRWRLIESKHINVWFNSLSVTKPLQTSSLHVRNVLLRHYSNEIGTILRKSNKLPSFVMFTNSSWVVSSFL
jgi:hypothetical protein